MLTVNIVFENHEITHEDVISAKVVGQFLVIKDAEAKYYVNINNIVVFTVSTTKTEFELPSAD